MATTTKTSTADRSIKQLASTSPKCPSKADQGERIRKTRKRENAVNNSSAPHLLTVKELAELCRVHTKTVRNWINGGEIAVVRKGRLIRISVEALSAFLKKHERS